MYSSRLTTVVAVVLLSFLPAQPAFSWSLFGEKPAREENSVRQRQTEFLQRIRQTDPNFRTIEKAIFNEQNELGLILSRSVPMNSIPALMRTMLAQMAHEFPRQDLTIIAYAASNPPLKIGTARLDARTRAMTYERARR
jgi:hypothetical protein